MQTRSFLLRAVLVLGTSVVMLAQSSDRAFDVVSIKRNVSGDQNLGFGIPRGDLAISTTNVALQGLVMRAYQVKNVANAPAWLSDERYDVTAKTAGKPTADEVNAMLRTMLKERLKLAAHVEKREISVYALVVDRPNHPGLKAFTRDCDAIRVEREAAERAGQPPLPPGPNSAPPCGYTWSAEIDSGGITMQTFAGMMDYVAGRVVVDRTGLAGRYEFTLRYARNDLASARQPDDPPDFFTALREQLGLRLDATRAPVDTVVIDHIERPTPN